MDHSSSVPIVCLLFGYLVFFTMSANGKIPYRDCKYWGQYGRPSCENIYLWNKDLEDFVSLFNVSFSVVDEVSGAGNLHRETVKVIADNMLPYVTSSNDSQILGGYLGDIWHLIERTLGFKSNISSIFYDTGLEIITSGKADVMLAAVVPKKNLLNIEYSQPYFYNWYHLFVKTPEAKASNTSYLKIFDGKLWFASLGLFAILTTSVWITIKLLNSMGCRKTREQGKLEPVMSLPSCFLGVVSGFINQGFNLKLSSYSGRMQVMFALVLGVVLYSAMNAVLVAQLAVFDVPFPFDSLEDIAVKRTHSLCLRTNSFVYNNFTDDNRVIQPKWLILLNQPPCLDINNQTNLANIICNDKLVVLENRVVIETILKNYVIPCEIINLHGRLFERANSFLMLRAFKYRKFIDGITNLVYRVKRMRATGILQRLEDKWVRREKLVNTNGPKLSQITLDHVSGVLIMYFTFVFVSLLILLGEIIYFRYVEAANAIQLLR